LLKIGDYNTLKVSHKVEFGFYLDSGDGYNILLPQKYAPAGLRDGNSIEVFVYRDSEDREIATTQKPLAKVGEFACLLVKDINNTGIFLDWGLEKNLYIPYSQALDNMKIGYKYIVYVMIDKISKRVIASAKFEKFFEKKVIDLKEGQQVKLTICRFAVNGILAAINDRYAGILYENETYEKLKIGDIVTGYIKKIRDDKKIDLTLRRSIVDAIEDAKDKIINLLIENNGTIDLNDKSSPEAIKEKLQMSKLTFKKALGGLYKERRIVMGDKNISMMPER